MHGTLDVNSVVRKLQKITKGKKQKKRISFCVTVCPTAHWFTSWLAYGMKILIQHAFFQEFAFFRFSNFPSGFSSLFMFLFLEHLSHSALFVRIRQFAWMQRKEVEDSRIRKQMGNTNKKESKMLQTTQNTICEPNTLAWYEWIENKRKVPIRATWQQQRIFPSTKFLIKCESMHIIYSAFLSLSNGKT